MSAYYNEFDPFAAAWLRELIKADLIAPGDVDERSITEVTAADVRGYTQCHFFAGIGGWSLALRLAGWADTRPVWTGSCPCQPFSGAGKREGGRDDRHLWPHWARLIRECRPVTVFGEQVESAIAHGWLDLVCDDLEREGYAIGAACVPAAGVGAPHRRQRLWFVADADSAMHARQRADSGPITTTRQQVDDRSNDVSDGWARVVWSSECNEDGECPNHTGIDYADCPCIGPTEDDVEYSDRDGILYGRRLGDTGRDRLQGRSYQILQRAGRGEERDASRQSGDSQWADIVWLPCRDGKARPTQPGLFPLAHGVSARVGRLRGYGNAIVPQVAAEVIRAYMEVA